MSEDKDPSLEHVGGQLLIYIAGFTKLPAKLKTVEGDAHISRDVQPSLIRALLAAKQS